MGARHTRTTKIGLRRWNVATNAPVPMPIIGEIITTSSIDNRVDTRWNSAASGDPSLAPRLLLATDQKSGAATQESRTAIAKLRRTPPATTNTVLVMGINVSAAMSYRDIVQGVKIRLAPEDEGLLYSCSQNPRPVPLHTFRNRSTLLFSSGFSPAFLSPVRYVDLCGKLFFCT